MNEKFFELSKEKQQGIINAAMEVFSMSEYKHASTDLIAAKAGVSKGLLFYYFHNKKELYLYVYDYMVEITKSMVLNPAFHELTDFFDLMKYGAEKKLFLVKQNPHILYFAMKAFYSDREAVSDDLKGLNTAMEEMVYQQFMAHVDTSKFKTDVNPRKVYKMLLWMADGYLHNQEMAGKEFDPDAMMKEFDEWIIMMKRLVYKEEFQDEHH